MKTLNRSFKWILIFIALILLALIVFVTTFDANNYKPEIIEQVEEATGRDFTIDGEINLSIFRWIGLKVERVALGNEEGFSDTHFAQIEQLDIRVNVLPLLSKEVEINTIRMHGLNVSLEVAEDKSNNWSSLSKADEGQEDSKEAVSEAVEEEKPVSPLQALKVDGFEFVDAMIQYDDRSTSARAIVSELNLKTSAIQFDKPVDVSFGARVENSQPVLDTRISMTTQLTLNQELTNFSLLDFTISIVAKANEMLQQDETIEIKSTIDVSMDEQRVTLKQTQLTALGTTTVSDIAVTQFLQTPHIIGTIEVQPFNAREVAKRIGVELPEMAKKDALNKVGVKSSIKMQGEKLEANDFSLLLDDSTLSGWLHVINLSKQQLRYDLVLNQINLNDYLPPVAADAYVSDETVSAEADITVEQASSGDEKIELPVEMMRELDLKGDLRVASLTAKEHSIKQLQMSTDARQGRIVIDPLSMSMLDGAIKSTVIVDVRKAVPLYDFKIDVDQVEMGAIANPYLKGAMGSKELTMKGAADLNMDVQTSGESVNGLKKSATGKIVLDMKETEVNGFDPEFFMRESVANYMHSKGFGLSQTIMGDYEPREVTVFDLIHGTVNLAKGVARTDDFKMDSKRVQIGAKGHANIMQNTLDVTSSTTLPRGKTAVEKVLDSPLFVRVHGPFDALQYDLDTERLKASTSDALKNEAKAQAEEKAKEELKRGTDRLQDKLKDKLKGFF